MDITIPLPLNGRFGLFLKKLTPISSFAFTPLVVPCVIFPSNAILVSGSTLIAKGLERISLIMSVLFILKKTMP